jgi:hypothetical protein
MILQTPKPGAVDFHKAAAKNAVVWRGATYCALSWLAMPTAL